MTSVIELDERISKCEKILSDDPNSQIFAALAESHRKKGQLEKAFRICQTGLKIHPSYASAHIVMAKINLDRGLYDWAEIEANTAADLGGRTRTVELLLAEIYIYKGDFDQAIRLLRHLYTQDPHNSQIKKLLEIAERLPREQARLAADYGQDTGVSTDETSGEEETPPPPVEPDLDNKALLEKAVEIPGVEGGLFVNFEGLVVDSNWMTAMDATTCGATISEIGNELNEQLLNNSFGRIRAVLIETGNATFYVIRVDRGVFLFVAGADANLGAIRMKVEKLMMSYRP